MVEHIINAKSTFIICSRYSGSTAHFSAGCRRVYLHIIQCLCVWSGTYARWPSGLVSCKRVCEGLNVRFLIAKVKGSSCVVVSVFDILSVLVVKLEITSAARWWKNPTRMHDAPRWWTTACRGFRRWACFV